MQANFRFFNPFREAFGEIRPSFGGRIAVLFEGMGGAFEDAQALEFYRLFGEALKEKGLIPKAQG